MHSQALPTTVRAHQPLSEPTFLALSLSKTSLAKVRMSPALSPLAPRSVTVSLAARSTSVSVSSAAAGPIRNADPSAAVRTTAAMGSFLVAVMALLPVIDAAIILTIVKSRSAACQADRARDRGRQRSREVRGRPPAAPRRLRPLLLLVGRIGAQLNWPVATQSADTMLHQSSASPCVTYLYDSQP